MRILNFFRKTVPVVERSQAIYCRMTYVMLDGTIEATTLFPPYQNIQVAENRAFEIFQGNIGEDLGEQVEEGDERNWSRWFIEYVTEPPYLELEITASYVGIYTRKENRYNAAFQFALSTVLETYATQEGISVQEAKTILTARNMKHVREQDAMIAERTRKGL